MKVDIAASAAPTGMETLRWASSMRVYFDAGMPVPTDIHSSPIAVTAANGPSATDERRATLVSLPGPRIAADVTALPAGASPRGEPSSAGVPQNVRAFLPITLDEITQAVETDPFNPLRTRPETRYSGIADVAPVESDAQMTDGFSQLPAMALLGTSVNGPSNTAIIRVGDFAARLVAEGDTLDGIQVLRIERSRATVTVGDTTLTLFLKYSGNSHQ